VTESSRSFPGRIWIGHLRLTPGELLSLLAGLAVFGYLGWDSPLWDGRLQLLLHVVVAGAVAAGVALLLAGAEYPRSRLDVPVLILLLAIGVAAVQGQNRGLAAQAFLASLAYASLLPMALAALRRRPDVVALVIVVPTLLIAASILWQLISRRLGWFALGVGGLPPIRLGGETTAFGSVAVPPFVLLGLLPICLLLRPTWARRTALLATFVLLAPLAILSGSRSAWLALGASAVVFFLPRLRPALARLRALRPGYGSLVAALIAVPIVVLAVAYVAPRFTAVTSLLYRERLWSDTLATWSVSPILGIGPGTMPYARQAAAAVGLPPVRQPHSHDLAIGVLGDAGLVGLGAALLVVVTFAWIAGPQRSRTIVGRAASSVLLGFLVAGLVEDLTFLPNFDVLVIVLAAMALLDADAVGWRCIRPSMARWAGAVALFGGLGVLVIAIPGDLASATFRFGSEAAWSHQWRDASGWYANAMALDPWQPSGPKALAVAADSLGDEPLALAAARDAVRLNPGDGASWTNLALLCSAAGDRACTDVALEGAVRASGTTGQELINAALLEERMGQPAKADQDYALSLATNRNTALAIAWPRPVQPDLDAPAATANAQPDLVALLAAAANGSRLNLQHDAPPAVRALALAIAGDRAAAEIALADAKQRAPSDTLTWEIAAALERHWGENPSRSAAVAAFLRGSLLGTASPQIPDVTFELASLHVYPRDMLVRSATRLNPVPPWPWVLERLLSGG
jgi:O-antigen ligase